MKTRLLVTTVGLHISYVWYSKNDKIKTIITLIKSIAHRAGGDIPCPVKIGIKKRFLVSWPPLPKFWIRYFNSEITT